MKRPFLLIAFLAVGTVLGGVLYRAACPVPSDDERRIEWLVEHLQLTDAQRTRITDIHKARCPKIYQLGANLTPENPGNTQRCRTATLELIRAVSAELTPEQRSRYEALVAPCQKEDAAGRP